MSIFAETECRFSAVSIVVYIAFIHHFTCRFEVRQALIHQLVLGLTGENGKYNYSRTVHVYPPFFDISCSALTLAYLTPKFKAWLEANASKTTQERVQQLIRAFARAAEQLYHDTDLSGEIRSRFVREQLTALGVEVTEAVINRPLAKLGKAVKVADTSD